MHKMPSTLGSVLLAISLESRTLGCGPCRYMHTRILCPAPCRDQQRWGGFSRRDCCRGQPPAEPNPGFQAMLHPVALGHGTVHCCVRKAASRKKYVLGEGALGTKSVPCGGFHKGPCRAQSTNRTGHRLGGEPSQL